MKKAILLALFLSGCTSNEPKKYLTSEYEDDHTCQSFMKNKVRRDATTYDECRRALVNFANSPPPVAVPAQSSGPTYYPQAAGVPVSDAPVLQNIIPPTVRCQSVPAGLGAIQTVCR